MVVIPSGIGAFTVFVDPMQPPPSQTPLFELDEDVPSTLTPKKADTTLTPKDRCPIDLIKKMHRKKGSHPMSDSSNKSTPQKVIYGFRVPIF